MVAIKSGLAFTFFAGITFFLFVVFSACNVHAQTQEISDMKKVTAPRASIEKLNELSPEFATLTDEVLFNDIWNRPGLAARDKSLITISVLAALGRTDQLESHIRLGLENGLTEKEIQAAMTHIAFYAGWPAAVSGLQRYKSVIDQQKGKK